MGVAQSVTRQPSGCGDAAAGVVRRSRRERGRVLRWAFPCVGEARGGAGWELGATGELTALGHTVVVAARLPTLAGCGRREVVTREVFEEAGDGVRDDAASRGSGEGVFRAGLTLSGCGKSSAGRSARIRHELAGFWARQPRGPSFRRCRRHGEAKEHRRLGGGILGLCSAYYALDRGTA